MSKEVMLNGEVSTYLLYLRIKNGDKKLLSTFLISIHLTFM